MYPQAKRLAIVRLHLQIIVLKKKLHQVQINKLQAVLLQKMVGLKQISKKSIVLKNATVLKTVAFLTFYNLY